MSLHIDKTVDEALRWLKSEDINAGPRTKEAVKLLCDEIDTLNDVHDGLLIENSALFRAAEGVKMLNAGLRERVKSLEDQLDYATNPRSYRMRQGHSPDCSVVRWPNALHPCSCGCPPRKDSVT